MTPTVVFVHGEWVTPEVRRQYRAHLASPARTDFRSFSGRTHWLIAQPCWEDVTQGFIDWIAALEAPKPNV